MTEPEIKLRKVVQLVDLDSPIVITIIKAAEKGIQNEDLYHFIWEEPGNCEFDTLTLNYLKNAQLSKYSEKITNLLKEIDNEKT